MWFKNWILSFLNGVRDFYKISFQSELQTKRDKFE